MFTGIIEELGTLNSMSKRANITLLEIEADKVLEDVKTGDSISVNGVCLTVVEKGKGSLFFEVMPSTLKDTNLGGLGVGGRVNLERSLRVGDRVSGHFISGHVDCTGVIRRKYHVNNKDLCMRCYHYHSKVSYVFLASECSGRFFLSSNGRVYAK